MSYPWEDDILAQPPYHLPHPHRLSKSTPLLCQTYGHSWQRLGPSSNEKQCSMCGIKGYCPGCTPTAPPDAQPFHCTKHTPASSPPQHREVQP